MIPLRYTCSCGNSAILPVFFILLFMYFYCYVLCVSYCMFMYLHRANWQSSAALNEVFPCFFLGCKDKCQGKTREDGARPTLFQNFCVLPCIVCFVSFCLSCVCVCVCKCVLYYCHRVATQLQLTNTSIYQVISRM